MQTWIIRFATCKCVLQWWNAAIFDFFLFDVLIKIFRTWCKKFISWTLFCHFTCLTTNHTDEITSNHRHSPMIFNSGTHQENMIGDIDTVLSWVICSDFAAHTHANMDHHVYHFYSVLQGWAMPFFTFLFDVLIKISRTWCKKFHLWTLLWHFPCLHTNHTDAITSNHRHSPMIFNSGTHQKKSEWWHWHCFVLGDLQWLCSPHTCKHGSSGLPRWNVFCMGNPCHFSLFLLMC